MSERRALRRLEAALREIREASAPLTLLGAVQEAWRRAVGEAVAAQAEPVAERDGVITVACRSATWAEELDLLQEGIVVRLNTELGAERVRALRLTADAARHD